MKNLNMLFLAVACIISIGAWAQSEIDDVYVYGLVKDYNNATPLGQASIILLEDGLVSEELVTDSLGRYELYLNFDRNYVVFYGNYGYTGKHINIDLRNVPIAVRAGGFGMNVDMTLFKEAPGLDVSILDEPIGKAKYEEADTAIVWDYEYTKSIQDSLRILMQDYSRIEQNDR